MSGEHEARMARLRDRADQDYAPRWDFAEIPTIGGVVESIKEVTIDGKPKYVATIAEVEGPEDARKRYAVWLSQAALFNRFVELKISPGELVVISYKGESEHHEPGKSPAKIFRVEVDREGEGEGVDWDRVAEALDPVDRELVAQATEAERAEHEAAMEQATEAEAVAVGGGGQLGPDDDIPFA